MEYWKDGSENRFVKFLGFGGLELLVQYFGWNMGKIVWTIDRGNILKLVAWNYWHFG